MNRISEQDWKDILVKKSAQIKKLWSSHIHACASQLTRRLPDFSRLKPSHSYRLHNAPCRPRYNMTKKSDVVLVVFSNFSAKTRHVPKYVVVAEGIVHSPFIVSTEDVGNNTDWRRKLISRTGTTNTHRSSFICWNHFQACAMGT